MGIHDYAYSSYKFSIADLPERCVDVMYGNYALDPRYMQQMYVLKEDEGIII